MKVTILVSSEKHPIYPWLEEWCAQRKEHQVSIVHSKDELQSGDILFLISCSEIINKIDREKFKKTLVIHASDLPEGRGWSPHVWSLLTGAEQIVVSLLEAEDVVDSGDIWQKLTVNIPSTALYDEINQLLFSAEIQLMNFAVNNFNCIEPIKQREQVFTPSWPQRKPCDSEIDINKSLNEQFNLLRVCDPNRFPAFFYKDGKKFILKIESVDE
ncbi:formyltransferase family protein [Thiomicrorhabdus sp. Kp2]|uniref:formyltransferase family protein n=1 Tax=Thiomicrorhabdus sp. Kp2 TaxID=1123518 RepID=UPI0003F5B6C6|nr:formyltransferase family protein [Thiomicrorhabdus sp. Kp2]